MSTVVLAGLAEIAAHLAVAKQTAHNWTKRYDDFPPPLAELASGPVWDLNDVVRWYNSKWC